MLQNSLRIFSETALKIPQLLPTSLKVTFATHPVLKLINYMLFSTIKNWGTSKPGCRLIETVFKYKYYGYAELSEKVAVVKKYLLLKMFFFGKRTCFQRVHILNSYFFWRESSSETVAVSKKYLSSRSS